MLGLEGLTHRPFGRALCGMHMGCRLGGASVRQNVANDQSSRSFSRAIPTKNLNRLLMRFGETATPRLSTKTGSRGSGLHRSSRFRSGKYASHTNGTTSSLPPLSTSMTFVLNDPSFRFRIRSRPQSKSTSRHWRFNNSARQGNTTFPIHARSLRRLSHRWPANLCVQAVPSVLKGSWSLVL